MRMLNQRCPELAWLMSTHAIQWCCLLAWCSLSALNLSSLAYHMLESK